jgi:hypothetical protein
LASPPNGCKTVIAAVSVVCRGHDVADRANVDVQFGSSAQIPLLPFSNSRFEELQNQIKRLIACCSSTAAGDL